MPADLQFGGVEEMRGKLKYLRGVFRDDVIRKASRAGAKVIQEEMITRAPLLDHKSPRSTAQDPGTLKKSIRTLVRKPQDGVGEAIIGPLRDSFLARWVEYGHRLVKGGYSRMHKSGRGYRGPGRQVGFVPAHPFLRPAFEASRRRALEKVAEVAAEKLGSAAK